MSNASASPQKCVKSRSSSKSSESLYSTTTAAISRGTMLKRKFIRYPGMSSSAKTSTEVRQRVQSARLNRIKSLQNQLTEALQHITTLTNENRWLKTIQRRHEMALTKYEGTKAELPKLLRTHDEELRVCQVKCRELNIRNRELAKQVKQKDAQLVEMSEVNKHLTELNKNKHLEQRETLSEKVLSLEKQLREKEDEIKMLNRKSMLESKNFKIQLVSEQKKYKELNEKLDKFNSSSTIDSGYETIKNSADRHQTISKRNLTLPKKIVMHRNSDENILIDSGIKPNIDENREAEIIMKQQEMPAKVVAGAISTNDDDNDLVVKSFTNQSIASNYSHRSKVNESAKESEITEIQSKMTILDIRDEMNEDVRENDKYLDKFCDEISKEIEDDQMSTSSVPRKSFNLLKSSIPKVSKRSPLDPQKKNKLLAALRSIESSNTSD